MKVTTKHQSRFLLASLPAALAMALSQAALAQTPPDAGQLLQEQREAPSLPAPSPDFRIQPQPPAEAVPGGAQVVVQRIALSGHSVFDEATLQGVLGEVAGQSFDLAGLRGLANRLTSFYHSQGYPFARAFLPAQTASDGVIRIEIVEGRYGKVEVRGEVAHLDQASAFVAPLANGDVIESRTLERRTLLLDDLPGIRIKPVMRPGEQLGTGDLDIVLDRDKRVGGEIGFDNHGNRYIGKHRIRANAQINSPFMLGDQISLRAIYTEADMWLGSLGYSLPVGGNGLRAFASFAHTRYELVRDFKELDATGRADIANLGLSYPLIRSQKRNLNLIGSYQYKSLRDKVGLTASDEKKRSHAVPIGLQFDARDGLAGGGITFGALTWTPGRLDLSGDARQNDTLNTHGGFNKVNLDLVRLQATPVDKMTLYVRGAGQLADSNLDSSESFTLGGANGVRAYPSGEGVGDEGWLVQTELRYQIAQFTPYAFFDMGYSRRNAKSNRLAGNDSTRINGGGVGIRYEQSGWMIDGIAAWRGNDRPEADTKDRHPRLWVSLGYRF
ncbi:ShlB/FhaC/HecB family hemolysin secretion/activation protein [Methylophaga lonarensis]|uniref:ShlB/FhaC/HecB family hemolysin secretion/activation protein n=1 Tax=Methylophaga lonarensis TaxID=999151 RepID=UPI003D27A5FB